MSNTVIFESTPNPATVKFKFPQALLDVSVQFDSAQDAERSPLAAKIFGFPWTSSVYLGPDFIAVTKQDWVDWDVLAGPLAGLISQHLEQGEALLTDSIFETEEDTDADTPTIQEIKRILNREIRPAVALDGGDIGFVKYENSILFLKMKGACSGCPSSQATLKEGIEVRMKQRLPEIQQVVSVN